MMRSRRHLLPAGFVCALWFFPLQIQGETTFEASTASAGPTESVAAAISAPSDSLKNDAALANLADSDAGVDSYWSLIFKLGVGLTAVIALAWGAVFLLRKSSLGQQLGGGGSGCIRVKERAFLGPKKAIYLVDIGEHTIAVGVAEAQIALLGQWQPGELKFSPPPESGPTFGGQFKNVLGQLQKKSEGGKNGDS